MVSDLILDIFDKLVKEMLPENPNYRLRIYNRTY